MDARYLDPFVLASVTVMEMVLTHPPVCGDIALSESEFICDTCNIVVGVTGQVQGQVIYGMSQNVAAQIASKMLGYYISEFDDLAVSAIAELGNMISGSAVQHLSHAGLICDITPPTVLMGTDIYFGAVSTPSMIVPLMTEQGALTLTVGLQYRN